MDKKKNLKKILYCGGIGFALIVVGFVSWKVYFSHFQQFADQEKKFEDSARNYYNIYPRKLPKKGETRELALQDLYDSGLSESLFIPGTKKLCSTDSWVRVYQNDNGEYEYYVNLECGKFHSKIDREGPEITLNGDKEMVVDFGEQYVEPGVKSVKDNQDGSIDVKNVAIDSSKVDVSKPGEYKVTYTVHDKIYNETKVERVVKVVDRLYSYVTRATDDTNYYRGADVNNYVQFSGMLWRIVRVNSDQSVKIVLVSNAANVAWSNEEEAYPDSNVFHWLNDYFYPHLTNADKYVVQDYEWCSSNFTNLSEVTSECNGSKVKAPVGLLSTSDILQMTANRLNYLMNYSWLIDTVSNHLVWHTSTTKDNYMDYQASNSYYGVKPVINLNKNVLIVSGQGTYEKPYRLNDYEYGKENETIADRLDGEYFNYSGYIFRKAGEDKDGNVHFVSAKTLNISGTSDPLKISYDESITDKKFDPEQEGNVGYKLNNDVILYLSDKYLVQHEFEIPYFQPDVPYDKLDKYTVKAYLSIPASYELFSGDNIYYQSNLNYMLADYAGDVICFINPGNAIMFTMDQEIWGDSGIKVSLYIKGNVKISSGSGTAADPYYLK